LVKDASALEALSDSWNRLWLEQRNRNVFSAFAWNQAAWDAYGDGKQLATPVVYDQSEVIGILPLLLDGRTLRFVASPRSDYNDILCKPGRETDVIIHAFAALAHLSQNWDSLELENVPDRSHLLQSRSGIQRATHTTYVHFSPSSECPRVNLSSPDVAANILKKKEFASA
jgi:CelD/BcsL family acetyltransferase involved in cellulose biosynthesis